MDWEAGGGLNEGDATEGEAERSTLPLRVRILGERRDARFGSTGGSMRASWSL